jgi:hypothetical protein
MTGDNVTPGHLWPQSHDQGFPRFDNTSVLSDVPISDECECRCVQGHVMRSATSVICSFAERANVAFLNAATSRASTRQPDAAPAANSAIRDETIGGILRGMRSTLGISSRDLARAFGTTQKTIEDLELGGVPTPAAWPEAARIIGCYGEALRVDVHPILVRLGDHLRQQVARQSELGGPGQPRPARRGEPPQVSDVQPESEVEPTGRGSARRNRRLLLTISAPLILVMGASWVSHTALPFNVARPVKAGIAKVAAFLTPRADGLRWVAVSDPRSRKADRLGMTQQ